MAEGLAERFDLTILARRIEGGVEISQPPRVPLKVTVGPASRVRFARMVARHLAEHRGELDRVIVQGYALAALAANVAGRRFGIPTYMLVCSPVEAYYRCRRVHAEPGKPFRRHELLGLEALARMNARVGQRTLVLSRHLGDVVRSHGGSLPIDVVPIYGVNTEIFTPAEEPKAAVRARLGLPREGALIFFSSRIAPEKDAETLLSAVRRLRDEGRDVRLLHRSGGYRGFLRDAARFGLESSVIAGDAVHPHRELANLYRACDLCVQASREEGLGFSPLEALACGVPVVATAVGGLVETIRPDTGWSFPVGDAEALAASIREALDHPREGAKRAAAGRELVKASFDRRVVFDRLERILQ